MMYMFACYVPKILIFTMKFKVLLFFILLAPLYGQ